MPIVPDDKDWTWVLDEACPDCGFEAATVPFAELGERLRDNAAAWRPLLQRPEVGTRPDDATWSALEYACHVRDVFRLYEYRLHLMLDEDDPDFPNWDQDVSAVDERYGEQDPGTVADDLEAAGAVLAASFDGVTPEQRARTGSRSDGARFTIDTFGRYLLHDPVHHVWDAEQGYRAIASAESALNRS